MENDHLGILLEDIRGKFDLVPESHVVLERKIEGARTKLKQDISLVNFKIDALNGKVDEVRSELKQDISRLDNKIDEVDQRLGGQNRRRRHLPSGASRRHRGTPGHLPGEGIRWKKCWLAPFPPISTEPASHYPPTW